MRTTTTIAAAALMVAAFEAGAVSRVDDGMTTRADRSGSTIVPGNRVARITAGTDFAHFAQYEGLPAGRTSVRCQLVEPDGTVQVDETELVDDMPAAGYAFCPYETDDRDADLGSLRMTMWINGERMGEQVLEVAGGGLSLKRKIKWGAGAIVLALMGIGWVLKQLARRREKGESLPAHAVVIGSKAGGAATAGAPDAVAASDNAADLARAGKRYEAVLAQGDKPRVVELGRKYIALLVQDREAAKAVDVFKQCLAADPQFRTGRGEDVLPLAKAARAAGEPKVAVAVLRGFDKAWPGHAAIPEVFVFSAQLLAEDLSNRDMARKILEHVLARYPGHHVASEAKRYLQGMPQPA